MSRPIDNRLRRRAGETFVGRERELGVLAGVLQADGPLAVHLFGIPGVGKSTLLARFAGQAREAGAEVLLMDCRLVEPTARGFLRELGQLAGRDAESLEDAVEILGASEPAVILALDHYETFLLMDTWLRQDLMPALPDSVRLVTAGREAPVPLWMTSPRWHGLFRALAVEPLGHEAALSLLAHSGLEGGEAEDLAAVTHGNPLALKLGASAAAAHGSLALEDAAIQEVMEELTTLFLADVDNPATREAVRATSVARRITRSLLRALDLPVEPGWESLRKLPFIDTWRDGLRMHDAVREALARSLRAGDPERYLVSRRAAWTQLREEIRGAPRSELWRYTADMLYLIENPVVREAFFPSGHQELAVEPARTDDRTAVRSIAALHEGRDAAAIVDLWWERQPGAFRVARNPEGRVVAFYCMCQAGELAGEVGTGDPVAAAWLRHLAEDPIAASSRALFLRRWLGEGSGESPSPEQAACWLDVKRTYMELRPALRRVYLTVVDLPTYAPVATKLGFTHLAPSGAALDGRSYETAMLDFGPSSVDGWITRLVGDELGIEETDLLDRDRRALLLGGEHVALTPLEFNLLEYLESLRGSTASRDEILESVWGHVDSTASSNVVDAVVKSLRRKLGEEAGRLETVRGFGYRWRAS